MKLHIYFIVFILSASPTLAQTSQVIFPEDTLLAVDFPKREYNFLTRPFGNPIGDVNGDGKVDYANHYTVNKPETDFFGDVQYISGIHLGGSEMSAGYDLLAGYRLYPAGDLNGDGLADFVISQLVYKEQGIGTEIQLAFNDGSESLIGTEVAPFSAIPNSRHINHDLDGDGNDDIASFYGNRIGVSFGNSDVESISEVSFDINADVVELITETLLLGDIEGDGKNEIIVARVYTSEDFYSTSNANYSFFIGTYQIDENRNITELEAVNPELEKYFSVSGSELDSFTPTVLNLSLSDINADGKKELLVSGNRGNFNSQVTIYFESGHPDSIFNSAEWLLFDNEQDDQRVKLSELIPVGDFNGDGNEDFLFEVYESSGMNEPAGTYLTSANEEGKIQLEALLEGEANESLENPGNRTFLGDLDEDGYNDFRMYISKEGILGSRIYYGNQNYSTHNYSDVLLPALSEYLPYQIRYVLNLSDLDNDGIDDIGVVKDGILGTESCCNKNSIQKWNDWLEIYLSGSADIRTGNPSIILEDSNFVAIDYPAIGDFNGDGYMDIALNYATHFQDAGGGIHIYFGGSTMDNTPDHVLLYNDLLDADTYKGFPFLKNIGDINSDGIDDLIFAGPGPRFSEGNPEPIFESFILFGGESLSQEWDLRIPEWGSEFENIGDMNGDGNAEIAIANPLYGVVGYDSDFNESYFSGKVTIYSAFDEENGEEFDSVPFMELAIPKKETEHLRGFGKSITSGDFDGDGFNDLVVLAEGHNEFSTNEPLELIFVYAGSESIDSLYDFNFKIPYASFQNASYSAFHHTNEFASSNFGAISGITDLNNDNRDELLLETGTHTNTTNSILYPGDNFENMFEGEGSSVKLFAPNQFAWLKTGIHYNIGYDNIGYGYNVFNYEAAFGDFNGDGERKDFIFFQDRTVEFVSDPIYLYNLNEISTASEKDAILPEDFELHQNYPNPFNPTTNISYSLKNSADVQIDIFNILGQKVQTLINEKQPAGNHKVIFHARDISSGIYIYRLKTSGFVQTKKMLLLK